MKRRNELTVPKRILNTHLRQLYQHYEKLDQSESTPDTVLSPLEQLPNEVIQQIFFNCFEINLPRASEHIAQALSTESTYRALVLFAYFDDNGEHPVMTNFFLPAVYVPFSVEQRTRLQSGILGCRWFTLDRLKTCLPVLSRLAMVQAWYKEKAEEEVYEDEIHFDETNVARHLPNTIRKLALLPDRDDINAVERHFFAKTDHSFYGDKDVQQFESHLPRIVTWTVHKCPLNGIAKLVDHRTSTLAARVLPDWLLRGNPWTELNLELLQLLRQGMRFVHPNVDLEISPDVVISGMASAIREQNIRALLTLIELYVAHIKHKFRPANFENTVRESNNRNGKMYPCYALPLHLFHLAAKKGAKSSEMVKILLQGSLESIPDEDVALTAWALERKAECDITGHYLLEYMAGALDDQLSSVPMLFSRGANPLWSQLEYLAPCPIAEISGFRVDDM